MIVVCLVGLAENRNVTLKCWLCGTTKFLFYVTSANNNEQQYCAELSGELPTSGSKCQHNFQLKRFGFIMCYASYSFPHLSRLLSRGRKPPNWVSPTIMGFVLGCCWPKPSYTLAKWKCNTESWTECLTDNRHIVYLFIYITELCLERQMWALPAFFFFFYARQFKWNIAESCRECLFGQGTVLWVASSK